MKTFLGSLSTAASLSLAALTALPVGVFAATAAETIAALEPSDFTYSAGGPDLPTTSPGGLGVAGLTIYQFPALEGQGVGMLVANFEPCSINPPHVHPRATEMIYMLKGELQVAFVEETGGTRGAIVNDISAGDSTFFPKGLVHYQQNLGCEEASYVAAVNSEDPGVVFVLPTFFSLPGDAIEVTAGIDLQDPAVAALLAGLPDAPGNARMECLARCGLQADDDDTPTAEEFSCSGDAGVLSDSGGSCCPVACGSCGGSGCSGRGDGADSCCTKSIEAAGVFCSDTGAAPCLMAD